MYMYNQYFSDKEILDESSHRYVRYGIQCFTEAIQGLVSGELTQKRLEFLIARRENLVALHKELLLKHFVAEDQAPGAGGSSFPREQVLVKIIDWREAEYKAFRNEVKIIHDAKGFISQSSLGNILSTNCIIFQLNSVIPRSVTSALHYSRDLFHVLF